MKQLILIIFIFLSYKSQAIANQELKKSNIEIGMSVGLFTASGISLRLNLVNDFSIKLSGFVLNSTVDDKLIYEGRTSLVYSVFENEIFELYFINSLFKTNIIIIKAQTDENIIGFASGFGFKLKIKEALPFFIRPHGKKNISLFVELQENITDSDIENIEFEPNVNLGILFNF